MANPKENIAFVLVRTQFASNLGSTVRVMKNMGFHRLVLVRPECEVGIEARSFAMKGADILDRAEFYPTLAEAASKFGVLIGTTGRFKGARQRLIDPVHLGEKLLPSLGNVSVGIVLGSEDNGLRREELCLCHWLVEIPTGSDYPILNLAQAAAVLAYQLHISSMTRSFQGRAKASEEQKEMLLRRIEEFLRGADLPIRVSVERLMRRIRKIAAQTQLEREDVRMLHGLIKEVEKKLV